MEKGYFSFFIVKNDKKMKIIYLKNSIKRANIEEKHGK